MIAHDVQAAYERHSPFFIVDIAMKSIKLICKYYLEQLNVTAMNSVSLYINFVVFSFHHL